MKIGDRIGTLHPFCDSEWGEAGQPRPAVCVWVHPKGRFCVLEFDCPGGKVRECYTPWDFGIGRETEQEPPRIGGYGARFCGFFKMGVQGA